MSDYQYFNELIITKMNSIFKTEFALSSNEFSFLCLKNYSMAIMSLKKKLENLLNDFENKKSLIDESNGKYIAFENHLKRIEIRGFVGGSLTNLRDKAQEWIEKARNPDSVKEVEFEKLGVVKKLNLFIAEADKYYKKVKKTDFSNSTWLVFYYQPMLDSGISNSYLAKAVLKIGKNYDAKMESESWSNYGSLEKFNGKYKKICNESAFALDLISDDGKFINLVIPISSQKSPKYGSYNRFDGRKLEAGTIVLQSVEQEGKKFDKIETKPEFLNRWNSFEKFELVDKTIIEYLSIRCRNYLEPIEFDDPHDFNISYTDKYAPFEEVENKFIEPTRPKIRLIYPAERGVEDSEVKKDIEDIRELSAHFKNHLRNEYDFGLWSSINQDLDYEVEYDHKISPEEVGRFREKRYKFYKTELLRLRNTRYFILFLPYIAHASMSTLYLGWALEYSKYVMIVYKKGCLSDGLKDFLSRPELALKSGKRKWPFRLFEYESFDKETTWYEINDFIAQNSGY